MKKTGLLFALAFSLLGGYLFALPVGIYKVELAPGTDAYRYAADKGWEVFYAMEEQLLVSDRQSILNDSKIINAEKIYQGDSKNLKWAYQRKGFAAAAPAQKIIFSHNGSYLLEAPDIKHSTAKDYESFTIKNFSGEPIRLNANTYVLGTTLVRDSSIATLTHLVDTAQVRTRIEALQSFNTRFLDAANHDSVVGWIRNQFLNMGITDVILDTFNIGFGPKQHNIIATIPGLLDTSVVYIVGGHYDSYSDRRYSDPLIKYSQAPGADDNASGTVAAMEMARVLAQPGNRPNSTVRFIAFDAEEYGLFGSEYYAQQALAEGKDIGCMLNYDMIGYKGNDSTFISKLYPGSEEYAYMLGQLAGWYGRTADTNLVPVYNSVYLNGSDSWEFSIRGFPVTYSEEDVFSTVYHQTNDSTTYMNMRYVTSIIKAGTGFLGTLANYPQKVADVIASDIGTGTELAVDWTPNAASNIAGYKIYYGYTSGSYVYNQYTTSLSDTISGLTSNANCYITVRAVDTDGKESPIAAEAIGVPVLLTLDKGILVVDETQNWTAGSFPRDTTQDKYYRDLLEGYTITEHEYGSSGEKPGLINLAPYSTVFWHADDYSSPMLNSCVNDLKLYLSHGGKLCIAGWKPSADITGSNIDTAHYYAGSFMYDYMKVSQMSRSLTADSFQAAVGKLSYQDVSVDPAKVPVVSWGGTMRYIEKLTPVSPAEGIYNIDMKNDSSLFEGQNCGVRYLGSDFKTALLGFPLYFMDQAQAKAAVQKIMDDFGEVSGVSGNPEDKIPALNFKLSQNAPNPFTKFTVISYQLPKAGRVRLNIYNIAGQLVKTLVNKDQQAGIYVLNWDRKDNNNKQVSAGVYIYHLSTGDNTQSRKMVVLK
ncbi:MAG: M20/M25/M40 family metallo-hydrolase [Candidatus Edwardsbacteria bacterium]|nr:M20/M25/M40 family metallo-hydrolase [Candidatus Edwardsbacteria bacterium]MBU1576606.1 M20/M25/M40 family metallo-hydrolase [Candidatus Edwardsbacteria bacterium]MBU2464387.1 M20/M25/M40 family metallo-hydrolase [Candidatus Edwardsbacteria bacterium]MBU2594949.1 M20/M25/M40 family metallo-hydrolase [Candidatus Edwardsbacteria bacterium]